MSGDAKTNSEYRDKAAAAFAGLKGCCTAQQLMDVKVPPPVHGDTWGDWTLDLKRLCLTFTGPTGWWYECDLEQGTIMEWLSHFSGKRDALRGGSASIGDLYLALTDLSRAFIFGNGRNLNPLTKRAQ